jgi:hypothetical protein
MELVRAYRRLLERRTLLLWLGIVLALFAGPLCRTARSDCGREMAGVRAKTKGARPSKSREFQFPSTGTKRTMEASDWSPEAVQSEIAELNQRDQAKADKKYLRDLDKIHDKTAAKLGGVDEVGTVFYPFAGSDGAAAFRLFPNATTVVALENNPFLFELPKPKEKLTYPKGLSGAWRHWTSISRDDYLGARVLGGLEQAVPGFRLRKVEIIRRPELQFLNNDHLGRGPSTHGRIEFDTGPGTPVRQYIHLDTYVPPNKVASSASVGNEWWAQEVERLKPDATIVKASMSLLHPQAGEIQIPGLRQKVHQWMSDSHGLLVEGKMDPESQAGTTGWEFTGHSAKAPNQIEMKGVEFGYTKEVRVTRY